MSDSRPEVYADAETEMEKRQNHEQYLQELYNPCGAFRLGEMSTLLGFLRFGHGLFTKSSTPGQGIVKVEDWQRCLKNLGFYKDSVPLTDVHTLDIYNFCKAMFAKTNENVAIPPQLFDLDAANNADLVRTIKFCMIHRPTPNLFVFTNPRSLMAEWLLGVESPDVALYCVRYIAANEDYTLLNLASHLITRGIKCRTLVGVNLSPQDVNVRTLQGKFEPTSFREKDYVYTKDDFATWCNQVELLTRKPRFRAGLLAGGLVARICRFFLNLEAGLEGPSWEAAERRTGFIARTGTDLVVYVDDELTEDETAKICGVYAVYDGTLCSWMVS